MSPEQLTGTTVDASSDQYSLAAVLYEMLVGEAPHAANGRAGMIGRRLSEPAVPIRRSRPDVPTGVDEALCQALAAKSTDRHLSVRAFLDRLEAGAATRRHRLSRRQLFGGAAVIAAVVLAASALVRGRPPLPAPDTPLDPLRIAVLPFGATPDTADQRLVAGLEREIERWLEALGRDVRVIASSVVMNAATPGVPPVLVGRAVAAGTTLQVRLVAQPTGRTISIAIHDVTTGKLLHDSSLGGFDQDMSMMAATAARRLAQLRGVPLKALLPAPVDPRAYRHYLRGQSLLGARTQSAVGLAVQEFKQAIRIDSTFVSAQASLAYALSLFVMFGWELDGKAGFQLAPEAFAIVDQALTKDSNNAEAWLARGSLLLRTEPRLSGAREAFERALTIDPHNPEIHHTYASVLRRLGEDPAAFAAYHQALAIDPRRVITLVELGSAHFIRGDFLEATRWLDSASAIEPASILANGRRAMLELARGDTANAARVLAQAERIGGGAFQRMFYPALQLRLLRGDTAGALQIANAAFRALPASGPVGDQEASELALGYLQLGQPGTARALLRRGYPGGYDLWFYLRRPAWDPWRAKFPWLKQLEEELTPPGALPLPRP